MDAQKKSMKYEIPFIIGQSKCVINPNYKNDDRKWFINDHCIFEDQEGVVHFFGIHNPYPDDMDQLYTYHPYIGHSICGDNIYDWTKQPHALDDSNGEEYLGAPFVTYLETQGRYVMLFEAMQNKKRILELAYSDDCYYWERQGESILQSLGYTKRDPFIMKSKEGKYVIYLANPTKKGSSIAVVETEDFIHFTDPKICLSIPDDVSWSGIESPFVVERDGLYYLFFTYAHRHYYETVVCVSYRYDLFTPMTQVTTLFGHASEIFTYKDKQYITSCGPEDMQCLNKHGLYIARLEWVKGS